MDVVQIVSALLVVLCGACLQGMVAFGFGLFAVPLLLALDFPVPTVLPIVAISTLAQTLSGVHRLRHAVPWKVVRTAFAIRVLAMTLGIWVLSMLASSPTVKIRFWLGLVVLLLVLLRVMWQPEPRSKLPVGWDVAAFVSSGFTSGLCSMGGPPLVLWVMAHDWSTDKTRAFLFASFMALVPFQLALLYLTFGKAAVQGMVLGIAFCPVVLLGSLVGLRIGAHFSKCILNGAAALLLVLIALNAILPGICSALRP